MNGYEVRLPREIVRGGHASTEVLDIIRGAVKVEDLDSLYTGFEQDLDNLTNAIKSPDKRNS